MRRTTAMTNVPAGARDSPNASKSNFFKRNHEEVENWIANNFRTDEQTSSA